MLLFDGERHVADKEIINLPWSGNKKNFRCYFCGYKFSIGDGFRMIYTNDIPGSQGNPLVCDDCFTDKEDTRKRWVLHCVTFKSFETKYWWFLRHLEL